MRTTFKTLLFMVVIFIACNGLWGCGGSGGTIPPDDGNGDSYDIDMNTYTTPEELYLQEFPDIELQYDAKGNLIILDAPPPDPLYLHAPPGTFPVYSVILLEEGDLTPPSQITNTYEFEVSSEAVKFNAVLSWQDSNDLDIFLEDPNGVRYGYAFKEEGWHDCANGLKGDEVFEINNPVPGTWKFWAYSWSPSSCHWEIIITDETPDDPSQKDKEEPDSQTSEHTIYSCGDWEQADIEGGSNIFTLSSSVNKLEVKLYWEDSTKLYMKLISPGGNAYSIISDPPSIGFKDYTGQAKPQVFELSYPPSGEWRVFILRDCPQDISTGTEYNFHIYKFTSDNGYNNSPNDHKITAVDYPHEVEPEADFIVKCSFEGFENLHTAYLTYTYDHYYNNTKTATNAPPGYSGNSINFQIPAPDYGTIAFSITLEGDNVILRAPIEGFLRAEVVDTEPIAELSAFTTPLNIVAGSVFHISWEIDDSSTVNHNHIHYKINDGPIEYTPHELQHTLVNGNTKRYTLSLNAPNYECTWKFQFHIRGTDTRGVEFELQYPSGDGWIHRNVKPPAPPQGPIWESFKNSYCSGKYRSEQGEMWITVTGMEDAGMDDGVYNLIALKIGGIDGDKVKLGDKIHIMVDHCLQDYGSWDKVIIGAKPNNGLGILEWLYSQPSIALNIVDVKPEEHKYDLYPFSFKNWNEYKNLYSMYGTEFTEIELDVDISDLGKLLWGLFWEVEECEDILIVLYFGTHAPGAARGISWAYNKALTVLPLEGF